MFVTEKQARDFFTSYARKFKKIRTRLGTHVAEGELDHAHGFAEPVRQTDGHFNLHENAGVQLGPVFKIVGGPL